MAIIVHLQQMDFVYHIWFYLGEAEYFGLVFAILDRLMPTTARQDISSVKHKINTVFIYLV